MRDALAIPAFFAIKFFSYGVYCYFGLAWFRRIVPHPRGYSFGLAALRMGMGFLLGIGLTALLSRSHVYSNRMGFPEWFGSWVWTYVICYGVIRFLEWSVLAYWISGRKGPLQRRASIWTSGGVLLSFLTDGIAFAAALRIVGGIC